MKQAEVRALWDRYYELDENKSNEADEEAANHANQSKWFSTHFPEAIFFDEGKGLFNDMGFTERKYFSHE